MIWKRKQQTGKRRDTWFSGAGCAAAGGILFLIGLCVYLALGHILVRSTERKVARLEQQIRDAGQPLTLEEWDAYYPAVPAEENAALVYERAGALLWEVDPRGEVTDALHIRLRRVLRTDESLPDLREEMTSLLAECDEICVLLDKAVTMSHSRYSISFDTFRTSYLTHLNQISACAKLEAIRAAEAVLEGHQDQFVKCQENLRNLAESLRPEPLTSSQTVRNAIQAIQLGSLATGLSLAYLYPETLAEVEKFYQEPNDSEAMARALAGDRCLILEDQRAGGIPGGRSHMDRILEYFDPVGQSSLRRARTKSLRSQFLASYVRLIRVANKPYEEQIAYVADLRENGTGYVKWVEHPRHPFYSPLKGIEHMALDAVVARIGRLTIAIERYRSDYEELPGNLQLLVPDYVSEVPLDPYDGQPMRYVTADKDYMLYSVYFDRVDDGGAAPERTGELEFKGDWRISIVQ